LTPDALAGEVHDRVDAFERGRVDSTGLRIPADLVAVRDAAAAQHDDPVTVRSQRRSKRRPDETTGTADHDIHVGNVRRGRVR
jgi:hypothetical protein